MARPAKPLHMEAAGSLTPELEGREASASHPLRGLPHPEKISTTEEREDIERH